MEILLQKIPYDPEDEDAYNYIGLPADECYQIMVNKNFVGLVYLSYNRYFADSNVPCSNYIEWIEFLSVYQNKHLLRPIINKLASSCGDLYFEAPANISKKYEKIGCKKIDLDDCTGLIKFVYEAPKRKYDTLDILV